MIPSCLQIQLGSAACTQLAFEFEVRKFLPNQPSTVQEDRLKAVPFAFSVVIQYRRVLPPFRHRLFQTVIVLLLLSKNGVLEAISPNRRLPPW